MFTKAKTLLAALAVLFTSMAVPLSSASAAKPADTPAKTDSTWITGMNLPCWNDKAFDSLGVIKKDGYNAVRLNWMTTLPADRLEKYLLQCEKLQLAPTVTLCDARGKTELSSFEQCAKYWLRDDVLKVVGHHPSLTLELVTGWNPKDISVWEKAYETYLPVVEDKIKCNISVESPPCSTDVYQIQKSYDELAGRTERQFIINLNGIDQKMDRITLHFLIQILKKKYDVVLGSLYGDIVDPECLIMSETNNYGTAEAPAEDTSMSNQELIDICRSYGVGIYPMIWCGDDTGLGLNFTDDWVNYNQRGKDFSKLIFGAN